MSFWDKSAILLFGTCGVVIAFCLLVLINSAYGEEVSCQYLINNDMGNYIVSYTPYGEYELRWDYYMQRIIC